MASDRNPSTVVGMDAVAARKITLPPSKVNARPQSGVRLPLVSFLGLLVLTYVIGAAVMFFQFPSSGFLSKGFMGGRAWVEKKLTSMQSSGDMTPVLTGMVDQPGKTFDGYTVYACASISSSSTRIALVNMQREVVHQWAVSFSKIWPNPPHLQGRQIDDSLVCIFACHLYPNGDLLVVFNTMERTVRGYGLAKIDKDSNLVWSYPANVHHDVTVGEDGTIYALSQRQITTSPKGLEFIPLPWFVDYLVMLSPEGKELKEPISLLDAVKNSQYATLLSPLETALNESSMMEFHDKTLRDLQLKQDVIHANSVKVLSRAMAPKFPNFKAGQVLISLRNLQAIAVFDPPTSSIVWGACGPWHQQHDAQFLDNGHLLMFDNIGSPRGSRVLEYDPQNGSFPWSYPGVDNQPFYSRERGMCQRLPNGNTLIVNSEGKEIIEVTQSKEVVWTCGTHAFITTARRYGPDQVLFLNSGPRP
jgi:hypothetical protein